MSLGKTFTFLGLINLVSSVIGFAFYIVVLYNAIALKGFSSDEKHKCNEVDEHLHRDVFVWAVFLTLAALVGFSIVGTSFFSTATLLTEVSFYHCVVPAHLFFWLVHLIAFVCFLSSSHCAFDYFSGLRHNSEKGVFHLINLLITAVVLLCYRPFELYVLIRSARSIKDPIGTDNRPLQTAQDTFWNRMFSRRKSRPTKRWSFGKHTYGIGEYGIDPLDLEETDSMMTASLEDITTSPDSRSVRRSRMSRSPSTNKSHKHSKASRSSHGGLVSKEELAHLKVLHDAALERSSKEQRRNSARRKSSMGQSSKRKSKLRFEGIDTPEEDSARKKSTTSTETSGRVSLSTRLQDDRSGESGLTDTSGESLMGDISLHPKRASESSKRKASKSSKRVRYSHHSESK